MSYRQRLAEANRGGLALVVLLATTIFAVVHFQALTNPYIINDDVRQQLYWMQQWLDPELFPDDLLTDYARHYVPWGVKGLYWLASVAVDPIYFSKLLPGILFVFLSGCLYKLGELTLNRRLAWALVGVFWLMPWFLANLSGGLARAFAAPWLALFWLGWLARTPWVMGAALLLQALFIPYIFPVAASAAIFAWAVSRTGRGDPPPFPARASHFAGLALGGGLVLLFNYHLTTAGFGPLVSAAEMVNRPEFTAQGRFAILPLPSIFWELVKPWEFIAPFREWGVVVGSLSVALIIGLAVYGGRGLDWQTIRSRLQPLWYLGVSSLLFYFLARLFLLKLFIPDRYLIYTLNLFYCLSLALGWVGLSQNWPWPRRWVIGGLLLLVGLSCLRLRGVGLYDYSAYRPLYAALARTPKEVLIAGHPNLMDNIPTFARRRAFATFELAHPWCKGYWQKIGPRLEEFFNAYYASDIKVVEAFGRKHHIAYLVVDDRHFTPAFMAGQPFFAPFGAQIRRLAKEGRNFILLSQQFFPVLKVDEHLRVLDLRSRRPQGYP